MVEGVADEQDSLSINDTMAHSSKMRLDRTDGEEKSELIEMGFVYEFISYIQDYAVGALPLIGWLQKWVRKQEKQKAPEVNIPKLGKKLKKMLRKGWLRQKVAVCRPTMAGSRAQSLGVVSLVDFFQYGNRYTASDSYFGIGVCD